jgi:hypothetical protein
MRRAGPDGSFRTNPADTFGIGGTFGPDGSKGADTVGTAVHTVVREPHGATLRYRIPAQRLRRLERRLAAGRKASLTIGALATDLEGNFDDTTAAVRFTR